MQINVGFEDAQGGEYDREREMEREESVDSRREASSEKLNSNKIHELN